jgi:formylglycine-generating enzyme required for sulfatase activity
VFETPPSHPLSNGASGAVTNLNPRDLFIDLEGTNVGFKHWHPVSVTEKGSKLCGQSDLGGVWEWTSTVLEEHDGFEPMELYPGYTGRRGSDGLLLLNTLEDDAANSRQPTSSTVSTTSRSEGRGRRIRALQGARPCEYTVVGQQQPRLMLTC